MIEKKKKKRSKIQSHVALSLVATLNWVNVILYRLRDCLSKQANSLITLAKLKVPYEYLSSKVVRGHSVSCLL